MYFLNIYKSVFFINILPKFFNFIMEIDIDTNAIGQNFVKLTNIVDDMLNTKLGIIDLYLENNQTLSENFLELQLNQFILINSPKLVMAYGVVVKNCQNHYGLKINESLFIYSSLEETYQNFLCQVEKKKSILKLNVDNILIIKDSFEDDNEKERKIKTYLLLIHYCVLLYCSFFSKYRFNIHDKILILNSEGKNENIILTKILQMFNFKVNFTLNSTFNKDELLTEFKNREVIYNEDINSLSKIKEFSLGINYIFDFQKVFQNDRMIIYSLLCNGGTTIIYDDEFANFQLDPHDLSLLFKKNLAIHCVLKSNICNNYHKIGSLINFLSSIQKTINVELISYLLKLDNFIEKRIKISELVIEEDSSLDKFIINILI